MHLNALVIGRALGAMTWQSPTTKIAQGSDHQQIGFQDQQLIIDPQS
jgi:hypothetical protein